jgi:hypothetical protein
LISGFDDRSTVKPHIIGNTAILPCLFGANTAAISVGRILPDISAERDIVFLIVFASGNCCAFVMIGDSVDLSA